MRNTNRNGVIVIVDACKDVSDLFAAGWLPQWLRELWKQDLVVVTQPPKYAWIKKRRDVLGDLFRVLVLVVGMLAVSIMVNGPKLLPALADYPWYTYGYICMAVLIVLFLIMIPVASWLRDLGRSEFGFWKAIKWLFDLVPMRAADFPQSKENLAMLYCDLMADLAKLVLEFESESQKRSAAIAKTHLEILFEGRCGFGFVRDPKKGLGPSFGLAGQAERYRILDVKRWKENYLWR